MNVNQKGTLGLIEVIRDLTKQEYDCFLPVNDHSAVDLIALKGSETYRLQVKYREEYRNRIEVPFSSVVNGKRIPIDFTKIDGWAVYCPQVDKVVYICKNEAVGLHNLCFRLSDTNQNKTNKSKQKLKLYTEYGTLGEWSKPPQC